MYNKEVSNSKEWMDIWMVALRDRQTTHSLTQKHPPTHALFSPRICIFNSPMRLTCHHLVLVCLTPSSDVLRPELSLTFSTDSSYSNCI